MPNIQTLCDVHMPYCGISDYGKGFGMNVFGAGKVVYTKSLFLSRSLQERFSNSYFAVSQDMDQSFPFLNDMLRNHRKCPYWTLLKHFCPSIIDIKKELYQTQKTKCWRVSANELLKSCAPMHNVHLYLCKVTMNVVPMEALGSRHNFNCFMKHVKKLLSVDMHGQMSLDHMVDGIKTKSISWLQSFSQKDKVHLLKQVIHFLVMRFICPLIQSFFYVSESTTSKNKLFFYRKKTWLRLSQVASSKFILSCRLKKVSEHWVQTKIADSKCLGVSCVRFLVKSTSLRPIVNLSVRHKNRASVNMHLKTLLQVLTFEKENNPEVFGATLMGVEDIHGKWAQFVNQCKQRTAQKLYFVKVDIEKCYDTINPCLLYSIVSRIISKSSYKIYMYKTFSHRNGEIRTTFFDSFQHPNIICPSRNAHTENCGSYFVTRDILLRKLCALLFCNVTKVGRQHYVQTLGISQGSVLSTILCGAYYGYMEQTVLNRIRGKFDLMVRMVDDMLYVTPSRRGAQSFLQMMLEGIPQFDCKCNLSKCSVNFDYQHPVFGDVPRLSNRSPMRYCGLAFDTETLNVYLDFSNYINIQARDTLSWNLTKRPGSVLKKKMLSLVHPQCLSILLDKNINCEESIYYNILSIFAVSAVKFHCLVMHLPPKRRVLNNPTFFTFIVLGLPNVMIACYLRKLKKNNLYKNISIPVSTEVVHRLCIQTFLFKLKKHVQMYAPVIERLEHMKSHSMQDNQVAEMLPQVFTDIHIK